MSATALLNTLNARIPWVTEKLRIPWVKKKLH